MPHAKRRFDALREMSGLDEEVLDALVLLAAGSFEPGDRARTRRRARPEVRHGRGTPACLEPLGFPPGEAERLSSLHTRNFM